MKQQRETSDKYITIAGKSVTFCLMFVIAIFVFSFANSVNAYAAEHKGQSSAAAQLIDKPFYQAVENSHQLADRFQEQLSGFTLLSEEMANTWQQVATGRNGGYPFLLIIQICSVILAAAMVELFFRKRLKTVHDNLGTIAQNNLVSRISCGMFALALEGVFLLVFVAVAFCLFVFILPESGLASTVAANYLLAAYYIRGVLFLIITLLSPGRPGLRILPFSDKAARFLSIWIAILCVIEIILARSGINMRVAGAREGVLLAINGLIIASSTIMFAFAINQSRAWVTEYLCSPLEQQSENSLTCQLARHWHLLAFVLLLCVTTIWEIRVLDRVNSGKIHFGKIIVAILATPIFFSLDIWGQRLLHLVFVKSRSAADGRESLVTQIGIAKYMPQIQLGYRTLLLGLLCFFVLGLFRVDVAIGRMLTAGILTAVLIIILITLTWQFFTGWVDRRIREEMPADDEEMDEGGKGGSRRGTLLLLLRKFVLILLIIIAVMLILSALGLNIAPLIAGAGILGLAVSFGAQSLVTDIFSGIFFLIDDAFRVGDYIDTGSAKGLVEHISIRAVRLRHHRGMVQTVPFGKIGTVVNFSRDYIIMKLDFRVKYDTDVEKVRKIVKKMYKSLLLDEELGPKLLGKLKSQGVLKMDDSAMIMRIKFTTPPGEQFVMRKEILRRLQEAFKANDIEFAHRNVTVFMPEHDGKEPITPEMKGAATAAILNEERNNIQEKEPER